MVCLACPTPFHAVGLHYRHFDQTTDEEVVELLDLAAQRTPEHGGLAAGA
jgi:putative phosphoribosyl transferase